MSQHHGHNIPFLHEQTKHFIGNEWAASQDREYFSTINPATDETLSLVARGNKPEIDAAVAAAQTAWEKHWAPLDYRQRAEYLNRIAQRIRAYRRELATLESLDTGKPIQETYHGDILRAASNFEFFAELLLKEGDKPQKFVNDDGSAHYAYREPIGVVGLITPWNLPLYLATWKIAPALACGNTIVLKPAELTPLTAAALCHICLEVGLPPGVINVVHGFGPQEAGEALVKHPNVKAISFTGETTTGQHIMRDAAPWVKKLSFELGGKGASIVFADAALDKAVKGCTRAAFRNQGQICLAGSRLLVEESIADTFISKLLTEIKAIKLGNPLDFETTMGSLISTQHRQRVDSFVRQAEKEGALILTGGKAPYHFKRGAYYEPTVISQVKQDSDIIQNEVFGPVLTIQTFQSKEEAIAWANGTRYGLSCSVWSTNQATLAQLNRQLRFGLIWNNAWFLRNLNTPFGGMKMSGIGREGGRFSLDFYSEWKTISFYPGDAR